LSQFIAIVDNNHTPNEGCWYFYSDSLTPVSITNTVSAIPNIDYFTIFPRTYIHKLGIKTK